MNNKKNEKALILLSIIALIAFIYVLYEAKKWNCERVGMKFDMFVSGCIVKEPSHD